MSLIKQTVLDQREIRPDGTIQCRFAKQVVEDGNVLSSAWHRISLPPSANTDQIDTDVGTPGEEGYVPSIATLVNGSLTENGAAAVSADDWAKVKASAVQEWTPDVVADYAAAHPVQEAP